jgi:transposase-like protein
VTAKWSYFPEWLLERRKRAEKALVSVVATSVSARRLHGRMEKLVEQLGITRLSKSQVSVMARAGWLAFFRDLSVRGLSGVSLVTSDAHTGLVAALGATLPGASWQRCRTHYAANIMAMPESLLGLGQSATALGV